MSSTPAPVGDYIHSKTPAAAPLAQSGVCIWDAFGGYVCPSKSPMSPASMPSAAIFEGFFSSSSSAAPSAKFKKGDGNPEGFCGCGGSQAPTLPLP